MEKTANASDGLEFEVVFYLLEQKRRKIDDDLISLKTVSCSYKRSKKTRPTTMLWKRLLSR